MAKKAKKNTQIRIVYNKNGRVLFKQSLSLLLPAPTSLPLPLLLLQACLIFQGKYTYTQTYMHIFMCVCVCDLENCAAKIKMFNLFHFVHYVGADCAAHLHFTPLLTSSSLLTSLCPLPPLLLCTLSCAFTFQCTMGISKHFLFTAFIISFRV